MKQKIFLYIILFNFLSLLSFGQEYLSGTISVSGNSVMVKLKSNTNFNGAVGNLQFTLQIPQAGNPTRPTMSLKSNPFSVYLLPSTPGSGFPILSVVDNYWTYTWGVTATGAIATNFVSGVEINCMEFQFAGGTGITSARLAQIANGGGTSQENFYAEFSGDKTNYTSPFYGLGAVNSGDYGTYSYVQASNLVLPVKFTSFSATKKDNDALLSWVVENETSLVTTYEVERSIDGIKFDKINTIAKNAGANNIYNIIDPNLAAVKNNGIIYYRIKQLDVNGEFVYSDIRNVRITEKGTLISIFPNPVRDIATLKIDVLEATDATISLINADGKQLQTSTLKAAKGLNLKKIDMNNLPKGDYLLKVTLGTDVQTIKVVKL
jgi:Secretion system C-terminal sorting domain